MLNRIILIGRLTRDPELRYVPSGAPVVNFTLAVDRPFKNANGEKDVDFIDVQAWRKLAELVSQYTYKGMMVAVEGRLQIRSWEAQDGQKRKSTEVVADGVRFLGGKKKGDAEPESEPVEAEKPLDEDVPF